MTSFKTSEKEITIHAPWGKIAGLTWGDSRNPPVLLSPGRLSSCSTYRPLIHQLPATFFYVAIDLPGNGWSDSLPKGVKYTCFDLVPTIVRVTEHYKWKRFMYIGHSLGALVGTYFNMAYPGRITRMVLIDPIPLFYSSRAESFQSWYHTFYGEYYTDEKYAKYNSGPETAPKYTYEEVRKMLMKREELTENAVELMLERSLAPAGDGLYRFTYDQRMKTIPEMNYTPEYLKELYTLIDIPILNILAKGAVDGGYYNDVPFVGDESAWPNNNYRFKIVEGNHNLFINNPERLAEDVSQFLLADLKAKL